MEETDEIGDVYSMPLVMKSRDKLTCPKCKELILEVDYPRDKFTLRKCTNSDCMVIFPYIAGIFTYLFYESKTQLLEQFIGYNIQADQIIVPINEVHTHRFIGERIQYPRQVEVGHLVYSSRDKDELLENVIVTIKETTQEYIKIIATYTGSKKKPDKACVLIYVTEVFPNKNFISNYNEVIRAYLDQEYESAFLRCIIFFESFINHYLEWKYYDLFPTLGDTVKENKNKEIIQKVLRKDRQLKIIILSCILGDNFITNCEQNDNIETYVAKRNKLVHPKSFYQLKENIKQDDVQNCLHDVLGGLNWLLKHDIVEGDK